MATSTKKVSRLVVLSFWMLLLLLLLARSAQAATVITIPALLEVNSEVLYFKDVAHIETDNPAYAESLGFLRIGKAPLLGQTRQYRRSYFITRLKQLRIDISDFTFNVPQVVYIKRDCLTIEVKKLAEVAEAAILKTMSYEGQEVHIRLNSIDGELVLPPGEVSYQPELPGKNLLGHQVIPVEVLIDRLPYKKINVSVEVDVFVPVWVAKRDLKSHELLTLADLTQKRWNLNDSFGGELVTDVNKLLGHLTLVPIRKDKPVSAHKVKKPPLVEKGDHLTIKAFHENISLLTPGQALEGGGEGAVIRVKNLNNQKMVLGRVVNKEMVEVEVR